MTLAARVTALLDAAHVAHAVIGAAPLAAGVVRSSLDLDLLTLDDRVLDRDFWSDLSEAGIAVDVRRGDLENNAAATTATIYRIASITKQSRQRRFFGWWRLAGSSSTPTPWPTFPSSTAAVGESRFDNC